jgi:transposase
MHIFAIQPDKYSLVENLEVRMFGAMATATATATATASSDELEGPVLEVVAKLLAEGRNDKVLETVEALVARNEQLERQLAALGRRTMKANEGVNSAQLRLLLGGLDEQERAEDEDEDPADIEEANKRLRARAEAAAEAARQRELAKKNRDKSKPKKKRLPDTLPRYENIIEVAEDERACPECNAQRPVVGYDDSEVLEFVPAKLRIRVDRREKRSCKACTNLAVAPRGEKLVAGGQFSSSVAVQVVYNKYELGLPLHRQVKMFVTMGMVMAVSTLCDQVKWMAELLQPLWRIAIDQVRDSKVKHLDGTGLPVLDRDHPKGKRSGTIWGMAGGESTKPQIAAYRYATTKKADGQVEGEFGPRDILAQWTGRVVLDADTLFASQCKRDDLLDCGCNMHARRYFVKALDSGDTRASLVIGAFKGLYQVEEDVRDVSDAERLAVRQKRSTPIYDDIVLWCKAHQPNTPPQSPLGKAINYLLNRELSLRRFEHDGAIPIDNMAAEHNFISVALTRKNFLFAGSNAGAERAAIIYTILRCCRLANVDALEYLNAVLPVLAGRIRGVDLPKLMPAAWAAQGRPGADALEL